MPTFDTPRAITAVIDMPAGHIEIRAADRTDTVVDVRPTDPGSDADVQAVDQIRVRLLRRALSVTAPKNRFRSLFGRPPSVDVTVDLPTDSRVDVNGWADIRTDGRLGDSTFDTAAGTVRLAETGRLKLRTASRRRLRRPCDRPCRCHHRVRQDPHRRDRRHGGRQDLQRRHHARRGHRRRPAEHRQRRHRRRPGARHRRRQDRLRQHPGRRGGARRRRPRDQLRRARGRGPRGTAAWLDVQSGYGTVRSLLDATDEPAPSDDTVEVRARTGYGDIVIRRAEPATGLG